MIYSPEIQKAINLAVTAHQGQTRKGKAIAYIVHPLSVAIILSRAGCSDSVVTAGILHDVLEDTSVTKEELLKEFGGELVQIVLDVTEQDKSLPWAERKQLALEHVSSMSHDSMCVKSADLLSNINEQLRDYAVEGDNMFVRFNAPKEKQLEQYRKLIHELKRVWTDNPLLPELEESLLFVERQWNK